MGAFLQAFGVVKSRAMRSGRLGAVVLLIAVALVVGIVAMALRIVTPGPPSAQIKARAPLSSASPPLTKRLALVVLDGIRFDVATDGRRMPRLAERFRSHASAELWAEPISMTASAALVFGSGAHAEIDLAIRNESSQPTFFEDLFTIARKAKLRTGTVGDPVWLELYPNAWDVTRAETHHLAVGLSDDEVEFAAARTLQTAVPPLDLAVFHFANPDHMAHGHGVASRTYEAYIASFDQKLAELLAGFSSDTTVIVLGDHGATMAGIHGSSTDEQRRTFIVASGPGIARGARPQPRVDDIDLAPTMAALLGLPTPRHARGQPLVAWLDVSDEARAAMACANLRDLARNLDPSASSVEDASIIRPVCDTTRPAQDRAASALPIARSLDARLGEVDAATRGRGFALSFFAAGLTALLSFLLFFRTVSSSTIVIGGVAFAIALAISVFATANLEKLPGAWLTPVRVTLYLVFNAPLLIWVLRPTAISKLLERVPALAPVALPGALILTETHSALIEAYLLSVILVGFALTRGMPTAIGMPRTWSEAKRGIGPRLALYVPALLVLSLALVNTGNFVPSWLQSATHLQLGVALAAIGAFVAVRHVRLGSSLAGAIGAGAIAAACLVLRRYVPAPVGLVGWGLFAIAAAVAIHRKKRAHAELLALASYAWVSRDLEIPLLLASYTVAVGFGEALGKDAEAPGPRSPILTLSVTSFLFAWGYVQHVGIQMGLHFMHFDFAAGAFRDPGVTMPRIIVGLIYKYAVARGFLLFGVLLPLPPSMRLLVLRCLVAFFALRATVLVASLEAARSSFWTPVWVTSELPHVLLALVIVAAAYALASARRPSDSVDSPHSLREAPVHV